MVGPEEVLGEREIREGPGGIGSKRQRKKVEDRSSSGLCVRGTMSSEGRAEGQKGRQEENLQ